MLSTYLDILFSFQGFLYCVPIRVPRPPAGEDGLGWMAEQRQAGTRMCDCYFVKVEILNLEGSSFGEGLRYRREGQGQHSSWTQRLAA